MKASSKTSKISEVKPKVSTFNISPNAKSGISRKKFAERYYAAMEILRETEAAEARSISAITERLFKNAK